MIDIETEKPLVEQLKLTKDLASIREPIEQELKQFRVYFKEAIRTDVFLLNKIIAYLLKTKGKEMRPMLVFTAAGISGDITERTYVAATMVELMHTATLIHDDVVDDAEKRRGFLSINKVWKNKASVLLGDFLLSRGLLIALDKDEFQFLKVLSQAVKRMSEGELRQLKASRLQNMTREKYFQIISDKTASLIAACCECGAISASSNQRHHQYLRELGENIGIAFQIRDDLFDYDTADSGKAKANDINERKITLPLIAALDNADAVQKRHIRRLFRKNKKKSHDIAEIISFVKDNGGVDYSRRVMLEYVNEAFRILQLFPESDMRKTMEDLIRFTIFRNK